MPGSAITRHFATITTGRWGARQVHYRRTGAGPLVILFHQSPLSSRDMIATMQRWKSHFTCIAPDSPGFGLSDPLGVKTASMSDFADAAIEFMDALGVERAAVYGFHTGAMISGAIAAAYPERIVCAVANGYVMMSETEKRDIVRRYLPPFKPSWDGSHLAWLWARMREQSIFFPWYAKSLANRLYSDVSPPDVLHAALLDFMRSGDHYRVGYRAAFLMPSARTLQRMPTPMLVTAYASDVLSSHLPRIKRASRRVTVQRGGNLDETHDLCRLYIAAHRPPKAPNPISPAALRGRMTRDYIDVRDGQIRVLKNFEGVGRPVVILHDALGSIDTVESIASGFIAKRPILAIELPGHGESDNLLSSDKSSIADYAAIVHRALSALKLGRVDLAGLGFGGLVGLELALRYRQTTNSLVVIGVADLEGTQAETFKSKGIPSIEPDWFGGYLLHAWHTVRDQRLFWPWYERRGRSAIKQEPQIDPAHLQQHVLELFRSNGGWQRALKAQYSYPWRRKLKAAMGLADLPMLLAVSSIDPLRESTVRAAETLKKIPIRLLPEAESRWSVALLKFFEGR
ncbi:MAG: alpha/beta fold hydrolase [Steroidobacteraceae bacterium]